MILLGADPGLKGALAFLDTESESLSIFDMPVFELRRGGKLKSSINVPELARIIDLMRPDKAVVEQVGASPQMGVTSAFAFGYGTGLLTGVIHANFVPTVFAPPATWKKVMKVTSDKDSSRARATALYPNYSSSFARKKDDGRAEAVLLAHWLSLQA